MPKLLLLNCIHVFLNSLIWCSKNFTLREKENSMKYVNFRIFVWNYELFIKKKIKSVLLNCRILRAFCCCCFVLNLWIPQFLWILMVHFYCFCYWKKNKSKIPFTRQQYSTGCYSFSFFFFLFNPCYLCQLKLLKTPFQK